MNQTSVDVYLSISRADYLTYYQGRVLMVSALSSQGLRVQFPASVLREHVRMDGVHGWFRIHFDENNKLKSFERIS
jgi:hypothetical protein